MQQNMNFKHVTGAQEFCDHGKKSQNKVLFMGSTIF